MGILLFHISVEKLRKTFLFVWGLIFAQVIKTSHLQGATPQSKCESTVKINIRSRNRNDLCIFICDLQETYYGLIIMNNFYHARSALTEAKISPAPSACNLSGEQKITVKK